MHILIILHVSIVFRFIVRPSTGQFHEDVFFSDVFSDWFHLVVNFLGPNQGQGFQIYINGVEVAQT